MNSVCFFASYFTTKDIPYYIRIYLLELKKHFSEVVLLSSKNDMSESAHHFLNTNSIRLQTEINEGYDFGMWYKAFRHIQTENYNRIALVNDSCILFKPLKPFIDWLNEEKADVAGMSLSEAVSTHVQSYFLVLNKRAIGHTESYLLRNGIQKLLQDVITTYEIGLSTFLRSKGLTLSAFTNNRGYKGEFSPYYHLLTYQLQQGMPLIKKKIVFSSYRKDELFTLARMNFRISSDYYLNYLLNEPACILSRFELMKDVSGSLSRFQIFKYNLLRFGILIIKRLKALNPVKK